MHEIWNHFPEYYAAHQRVLRQSLEADLKLLDDLYGRDRLCDPADAALVKGEALRQLEIEFRSSVHDVATALVMMHQSGLYREAE
jgi:hypothetical protein